MLWQNVDLDLVSFLLRFRLPVPGEVAHGTLCVEVARPCSDVVLYLILFSTDFASDRIRVSLKPDGLAELPKFEFLACDNGVH